MKTPTPVCPHARLVDSDVSNPKIVCGPMEADQARADRMMEGSPIGVVIEAAVDPSTFFGFCCGTDSPTMDPDSDRLHAHYTACPVFNAAREWDELQERLFGDMKRPSTDMEEKGASVGQEDLTPGEVQWLTRREVPVGRLA